MNTLSSTNHYINFNGTGKLVPLSQYKGTILKLTAADKTKIAQLQKNVASLEIDLAKLENLLQKSKFYQEQNYYSNQIMTIEWEIEKLEDLIKEIKLNRLNKQQKTKNKIDLTI